MASTVSLPVRSRKTVNLPSIHTGRRSYPKADFPPSASLHADVLTPDALPAPISPGHRRRSSLVMVQNALQVHTSPAFWVLLWFSLNFSLTLSNKLVLNKFPFPYSITAFHALGGCIGTWLTVRHEDRLPTMSRGQIVVLLSFSVLYTLNIVVSNVSLQLVTVPVRFHLAPFPPIRTHLSWTVSSSCSIFLALLHPYLVIPFTQFSHQTFQNDVSDTCCGRRWSCVSVFLIILSF